jgi:hypothetical protein
MNASDAGGLFWVGGMQTALAVGLLVRMQAWMKCWQPYTNGRLARERLSDIDQKQMFLSDCTFVGSTRCNQKTMLRDTHGEIAARRRRPSSSMAMTR